MKTHIIALSGAACAGKSTFAKALQICIEHDSSTGTQQMDAIAAIEHLLANEHPIDNTQICIDDDTALDINCKVWCTTFAEPIKKCLQSLFCMTPEELEVAKNSDIAKFDLSIRKWHQQFGDAIKSIAQDGHVFAKLLVDRVAQQMKRVEALGIGNFVVLIPDLRYLKEFEALKAFEATMTDVQLHHVRIVNVDAPDNFDKHASEQEFRSIEPDITYFRRADSRYHELYDAANEVIDALRLELRLH